MMHDAVLGVDPGLGGAVAVLPRDRTASPLVWDLPLVPRLVGRGQQLDAFLLQRAINRERDVYSLLTAAVELVGPTPQMGVVSAFSFGRSAGVIEGVLQAMEIPILYVRPQAWKRTHGLIKKDKDLARAVARKRWPELTGDLTRKKDLGRAEALLIGDHVRTILEEEL